MEVDTEKEEEMRRGKQKLIDEWFKINVQQMIYAGIYNLWISRATVAPALKIQQEKKKRFRWRWTNKYSTNVAVPKFHLHIAQIISICWMCLWKNEMNNNLLIRNSNPAHKQHRKETKEREKRRNMKMLLEIFDIYFRNVCFSSPYLAYAVECTGFGTAAATAAAKRM